ncbi:uncharacterized protein LOC117113817 [Anneissia japonica]|uniref:uncharacterized protein LOC117113817 n=1 Tax=Anneissia japonica TaxID=1529436 RepID=UPI0014254DFD|nr:uncharacterized protein LOC117113817 [Anneissia japonica]
MKFAVTILMILPFLASASGLTCYECNSMVSTGCGNGDFDPVQAAETTCEGDDVCLKTVVGDLVGRMCGPGMSTGESCYTFAGIETCYCSGELCNNAVGNSLGFFFAFISFLVAKYL